MVIPVIGPSKAGKSESTKALAISSAIESLERVDLDDFLGSSHRGDGQRAVNALQDLAARQGGGHFLVDVGAGQLVSRTFSSYLTKSPGYPRSVVAVWCDETTFRARHGSNAENEVWRYYGSSCPLVPLWEAATASGTLIETSGPYAPADWAVKLERVVKEILSSE